MPLVAGLYVGIRRSSGKWMVPSFLPMKTRVQYTIFALAAGDAKDLVKRGNPLIAAGRPGRNVNPLKRGRANAMRSHQVETLFTFRLARTGSTGRKTRPLHAEHKTCDRLDDSHRQICKATDCGNLCSQEEKSRPAEFRTPFKDLRLGLKNHCSSAEGNRNFLQGRSQIPAARALEGWCNNCIPSLWSCGIIDSQN